jgi:hypothetical protein
MKKLFILLCALSLSYFTEAQNANITSRLPQNHNEEGGGDTGDNSGFGIKGGVNFNMLRGSDKGVLKDLEYPTTFHAGFFGQFPVAGSGFFSIQPEFLFNRKGFKSDSLEVKTDYLEVPLLFVFNVFDNVSFHIGPTASVLLTVKENGIEKGEGTKKQMNSFNYDLAAGVEGRIEFARIGARYNMGLNDIYKEKRTIGSHTVQDLKNGVFQVYVGVGF